MIFVIAIFGLPSIHKGVWLMLLAITLELWLNRAHWQGRLRELQHVLSGG